MRSGQPHMGGEGPRHLPPDSKVDDPFYDQVETDLEVLDGPTQLAVDRVPVVDQPNPVATYRDWSLADTRVVVCRIANDLYPGRRFESRAEALAAITAECGRVLEANYVPGRAFFRVLRSKP